MSAANKTRDEAAREYAGGVQLGMTDSQHDRYVGFKAGAEWAIKHDPRVLRLVEALEMAFPFVCSTNSIVTGQKKAYLACREALKEWKGET